MIGRRDLILGGACLAAAAGAYQLKPREKLNLLGGQKMAEVVPASFGAWESSTEDTLVRPETQGKLAAKLYSELVSRIYINNETGDEIMMLIAYGDTQSDLLQLHRPESCYPAVGFSLAMSVAAPLPLAPGAAIPGRRVIAQRGERRESIVYWTRLGEYLPDDAGAQREARLLTAMRGFVPDGALFRFSAVSRHPQVFDYLDRFVTAMVLAVRATERKALLGSRLAGDLAAKV